MADLVKFDALLDDLLKACQSPDDILGQHGLLKQLSRRLVERALEGELTAHLGYAPDEKGAAERENRRSGTQWQDPADRDRPAADRGAARL